MTKPTRKHPLIHRIIKTVLTVLVAVLLIAVFYLAAILGQPQTKEDAVTINADQPLFTASPAQRIDSEEQLSALVAAYPAPVMCFLSGAGPAFKSGLCYDALFEGGFGRMIDLTYQMNDGGEVKVQTIYPARAMALIPRGDFRLNSMSVISLAGLRAIRMENKSAIRLHAQGQDALYVLTVPTMDSDTLSALVKTLQLTAVAAE